VREYRGVVKNGVVILEDGSDLPDGTKVRVIVEEAQMWQPNWEVAQRFVGGVRDKEGRTDVSEKVDYYLAEAFLQGEGSNSQE